MLASTRDLSQDQEAVEKSYEPELTGSHERFGVDAVKNLREDEVLRIAGRRTIDKDRRRIDVAGIPRRRGLGSRPIQEDCLRGNQGRS